MSDAERYPTTGTRLAVGGNLDTDTLVEKPRPNFDEWENLSVAMQRLGPYFLSHDVRSEESSKSVAHDLIVALWAMGFEIVADEPLVPVTKDEITLRSVGVTGQAGNSR